MKISGRYTVRKELDSYFMDIAKQVATRATCDRKHVGAVIVRNKTILSTGYNGSIRGLPHCDDVGHMMENGHCVATVHAEANAIIQAATNGVGIDGATIYTTASPCWPCFKLIANAGIKRIVFGEFYRDSRIFNAAIQLKLDLVDASGMPTAAIAIIKNTDGQLLSISRGDDRENIGLPGGKVESGEDSHTAIKREVEEETGLVLDVYRHVYSATCPGEKTYRVDVFEVDAWSGTPWFHSKEGYVKWVAPLELCKEGMTFTEFNQTLLQSLQYVSPLSLIGPLPCGCHCMGGCDKPGAKCANRCATHAPPYTT